MTLYWRTVLICMLVVSMVLGSGPIQPAQAASNADKWEEIKNNLELVKPVRRSETFAEVYYRLETRLSNKQKDEFGQLNKKLNYKMSLYRMPKDVKVTPTSITFKENGEEVIFKAEPDAKGDLLMTVNGRILTHEEALSPLKTFSIVQEMMQKNSKDKKAWLFDLFVPQVHAINWSMWLGVAVAAAGVGWAWMQKKKDSDSKKCKNKSPICCNINSTLTQLASGCCKDAGGSDTAYGDCPTSLSIEGDVTPSAVIAPEATTTPATTDTGTTTIEANTTGVK